MAGEFTSERNVQMLQRILYKDVCRRIGGDLTEKQANRLMKTVQYYVGEVNRVKGRSAGGLPDLNREVLQVTLPDYLQYLERKRRSSGRSAHSVLSDIEEGPGAGFEQGQGQGPIQLLEDDMGRGPQRSQMDVSNAFAQLQAQRQEGRNKPQPSPQDFRISLRDEGPVPIDIFERIKQDREAEAQRQEVQQRQLTASTAAASAASAARSNGIQAFVDAGDAFMRDKRRAEEEAEELFAERERQKLLARAQNDTNNSMPVPPDMRALLLGDRAGAPLNRTLNTSRDSREPFTAGQGGQAGQSAASFNTDRNIPVIPLNQSAGNATLALPNPQAGFRETSSQQMIITREPDRMEYKEKELNLFVYSGDRDWISNSQETRYNFSVNFDPANLPVGLRLSPTSTVKFRNITRIELVKAIMPGESVDTLVTRSYSGSSFTYSAPYNFNVLSFPYIQVYIQELDNNCYGTNQNLNRAFGVLQYDANWIYDTSNANTRGYFAMIPKFLKCQKEYTPTPLSTLNKLTFRFERPDGDLVSDIPDTLDITQIYGSKEVAASAGFPYGYDATVEAGTGSAYYFIKTSTYFNALTVSKGDRIVVKNLTWSAAPSAAQQRSLTDFLTYIQDDGGLLVVDVGYGTNPAGGITIGPNKQGYCNFIVVRGKFTDPTLGGVLTTELGGVADASAASVTAGTFTDYLNANALTKGRLLNLSHQVQVVLRVITRDIDPTGFLRPDNL